jgi:hypothetical protein
MRRPGGDCNIIVSCEVGDFEIGVYAREQTPQSSTQQHNIISRINWSGKRRFVGIEVREDMREDRW